jgi:hypothetical protein
MIHISDITREKRLNHPREALAVGQTVRAVVLEVDRERRRIKLGIKQLEPTTVPTNTWPSTRWANRSPAGSWKPEGRAKVELGEGVFAECGLRGETAPAAPACPNPLRSRPFFANRNVISEMEARPDHGESIRPRTKPPRRTDPHLPHREAWIQPNKKIEVELAG